MQKWIFKNSYKVNVESMELLIWAPEMAAHNFWILEFVKEFSRHLCHPASSWNKRPYKKSHNCTPPNETYYTVFIVFPHSFAFHPLFFKVNCDFFTKKERVNKNIKCPSFISLMPKAWPGEQTFTDVSTQAVANRAFTGIRSIIVDTIRMHWTIIWKVPTLVIV